MIRTRLRDRQLPSYTRGEEVFNTTSHIVGGAFGICALTLCVLLSAIRRDAWSVVSSAIYGGTMIILYTMSSVYHGIRAPMAKKVMQVLDHCTIYGLIAGTYTPVLLCSIRTVSPGWGWSLFGIVWGLAAVATVFTAIDLKKYRVFSMICYLGMGWCIIFAVKPTLEAVPLPGVVLLLLGGIAYTVGAVLFGLGKKYRYMHSVFHLFVLAGSVLHFFAILFYVL